ncbi:EAL domain-containing protein [Candidatus Woesearchaeota archaeon]|nr:EAL domain-containing protein [Candidatus Woesearchaeota archaeon]
MKDDLESLLKNIIETMHGTDHPLLERIQLALSHSQKYSQLFEDLGNPVYFSTPDGRLADFNPAMESFTGYTREELLGMNIRDLWANPEDRRAFISEIEQKGEVVRYPARLRKKDGSTPDCWLTTTRSSNHAGMPEYRGVIQDVTEQTRLMAALREGEERLHAVVANFQGIMYSTDKEGIFILSEGKALEKLGLKPGQVLGTSAIEMYKNYPQAVSGLKEGLAGKYNRGVVTVEGASGNVIFDVINTPLFDPDGKVIGLHGTAVDITEKVKAQEAVRELLEQKERLIESQQQALYTDSVTQLPNFDRMISKDFPEEIARLAAGGQSTYLGLNIDGFKEINASVGHERANDLLRTLAEDAQKALDRRGRLFSLGGDKFGILLPGCRVNETGRIIQALQKITRPTYNVGELVFDNLGYTIGAVPVAGDMSPSEIKNLAELLISYGRDSSKTTVIFNPDDENLIRYLENEQIYMIYTQAIKNPDDNFVLYGQPVACLPIIRDNGGLRYKTEWVEVLVRMIHEEDGHTTLITPGEFIGRAEKVRHINMITPLDHWTIDRVLGIQSRNGHAYSINISGRSVSSDLVRYIKEKTSEHRADPGMIGLEFTETVATKDWDSLEEHIRELHGLGFKIIIDDYGSENHQMRHLFRIQGLVSVVKVDKDVMMRAMPGQDFGTRLLKDVVEAAKEYNIRTVAEGLETPALLGAAEKIGFDLGQGYLIKKPIPIAGFTDS